MDKHAFIWHSQLPNIYSAEVWKEGTFTSTSLWSKQRGHTVQGFKLVFLTPAVSHRGSIIKPLIGKKCPYLLLLTCSVTGNYFTIQLDAYLHLVGSHSLQQRALLKQITAEAQQKALGSVSLWPRPSSPSLRPSSMLYAAHLWSLGSALWLLLRLIDKEQWEGRRASAACLAFGELLSSLFSHRSFKD